MADKTWSLVSSGAAIAAAFVARKSLKTGWEAATGNEPPENPADPDVPWQQAMGWGLLTGAAMGLARMVASRETARLAKRKTGELPDSAVQQEA